jgi:hypothetical protein
MDYVEKDLGSSSTNNTNLLPILMLTASAAAIVAMFILSFFGIYFFFLLLPLTFSLPWSLKKLRRHKKKNIMECRGSSLTMQRKSSLQDQKWDLFHTTEEKWSVVAT